ncbi:MAG: hypothetical protein QOI07_1116 [Verrucomicrobiota bacterium]|jgi:hypothetical protein
MKRTLAVTIVTLLIVQSSYSDTIPIRGPEPAPGVKEAFEKFNADAAAWNRRCAITHSEAEQSRCEKERAELDYRKGKLLAGGSNPTENTIFELTLRKRAGGKVVAQTKSDLSGAFLIGTFPAGSYTLELRTKNVPRLPAFTIKIAGTKSGETEKGVLTRYLAGGAAFDIDVIPGTPLRGLISPGAKNAKTMIWLPTPTGSILPGRWVEQGSAQAVAFRNTGYYTREAVEKIQEHMSTNY